MNKVDFPIGVELPLRGGGVAVLYEFYDRTWFGRWRPKKFVGWHSAKWNQDGTGWCAMDDEKDILPPKRKAWVVWCKKIPTAWNTVPGYLFCTEAAARVRAEEIGGTVQEITEP